MKKKKKTQQQEQEKKKKKKSSKLVGNENNHSNKVHHQQGVVLNEGSANNISCGVIQDVWCGPGIGFSADAVGSVDCVVASRNVPARGKIDVEKINHREVYILFVFIPLCYILCLLGLKFHVIGYVLSFGRCGVLSLFALVQFFFFN